MTRRWHLESQVCCFKHSYSSLVLHWRSCRFGSCGDSPQRSAPERKRVISRTIDAMHDANLVPLVVYRSASEVDCRERSMVLQAAGIGHEIRWQGGGIEIWVAASQAAQAIAELEA